MTTTGIAPTEAQFQEAVVELAHLYGWRVAHFRAARTAHGGWRTPVAADGAGFVDLILVRDRVLFVELKAEKGRLTVPQQEWLIIARTSCTLGAWMGKFRNDWGNIGAGHVILRRSRCADGAESLRNQATHWQFAPARVIDVGPRSDFPR